MSVETRIKKLEASVVEPKKPEVIALIAAINGETEEDLQNAWRAEHPGQEPTMWIRLAPFSRENKS
jgi:hypothetical protein